MNEDNQVQYPLQAWIEGHYARDCGESREKCPYRPESPMALAWLKGWWRREQADLAKTSGAGSSD